ncbi:MAG TPA: saccharopine dehydrogenase NADP-binding domain-containing protein, partial [Ilumatobacteraceae bacterium]|nr:saccharopine dehydrogenase NADP-binding domain-containing protein [Ilumatobacteraceae bacterium]
MRPTRVLVLGCGSVAQCTLPLLIRDLSIEPQRITIVDLLDNRARVADSIASGVRFEQEQITPANLDDFLSARVGYGDLLLDLAWNIDNATILQWCRDHGVLYLNTSVEVWDPYDDMAATHPLDRTLYVRHMDLRRMIAGWGDNRGPTAVLEHGANPGLVSHFTKQALIEIAGRMLQQGLAADVSAMELALADETYNVLAMLTGTKVIHVSERDTQITNVPKQVDEFVNTWSVDGFFEEGIAPAELGWGTHEKRLPPNAYVHHGYGPCNQICIARPGMETWVRSWVPSGEIRGMVVRHGEALTINEHLTVWGDDGNPIYRPTVHYAYCPSDSALNSVLELRMRNWRMQTRQRILNDEITSGADELGVLLMGHP